MLMVYMLAAGAWYIFFFFMDIVALDFVFYIVYSLSR